MKTNIKYSPKKMWYIACLVRGMSVDEAIRQLDHVIKKGAAAVKDTILEAQELAVKEHNVEFKSNLWVGEYYLLRILIIGVVTITDKSLLFVIFRHIIVAPTILIVLSCFLFIIFFCFF